MSDTDDDCLGVHRILAGHLLHAVNLGYDEVAVTYLRHDDADSWEAEIVVGDTAVVASASCPLEAAMLVSVEVVAMIEDQLTPAASAVN